MTPAYGMELVLCHAGQTLLGGVVLGWILAWLCIALVNELHWPRRGPSTPPTSTEPDPIDAFRAAVIRQAEANLSEPDPIGSCPAASRDDEPWTSPTPITSRHLVQHAPSWLCRRAGPHPIDPCGEVKAKGLHTLRGPHPTMRKPS